MIVDGITGVDELVRAIRSLGGEIEWAGGKPSHNAARVEVEVDNHEAYERLPAHFLERDDVETDWARPEDVQDFVFACGRGDRLIADALAPRLFALPQNQAACAHALARSL